jgi:hypothetical protein
VRRRVGLFAAGDEGGFDDAGRVGLDQVAAIAGADFQLAVGTKTWPATTASGNAAASLAKELLIMWIMVSVVVLIFVVWLHLAAKLTACSGLFPLFYLDFFQLTHLR